MHRLAGLIASLALYSFVILAVGVAEPSEIAVVGTVSILHEDRFDGTARTTVTLTTRAGKRLAILNPDPRWLHGERLVLRGTERDGRFTVRAKPTPPAPTILPNTFGAQTAIIVLVNFQDAPTAQPFTVPEVQAAFADTGSFWMENSYGQTWLVADVTPWLTIPYDSTACDQSMIGTLADAAASGVGYSAVYAHRVYVMAFNANCHWGGLSTVGGAPSRSWLNERIELAYTGHELGHALGLLHSHGLDCGAEVATGTCSALEYGDPPDVMGSFPGHYNAVQKERLGWLGYGASPPLLVVNASGAYALEPYETGAAGLPKALKVLRSTDSITGAKTWYYAEARKAVGYDSFMLTPYAGHPWTMQSGLVVHLGTDGAPNWIYLLDMNPATDTSVTEWLTDAALQPGEVYTDATAGVTLTPLSVDGAGATVGVTVPCARHCR